MKNFNFAQFIATLVNSIFSKSNVELLPVANFKTANSPKGNFSKRGELQYKRVASKSILSIAMLVLMGSVSLGQNNPAAYDLSTGSFSFTTQTATNTAYPTNMQGWTTGTNNITSLTNAAPAANQSLVASGTTTTSGLSNLGANGFNFLSTGSAPNQQVGAICVSLNATGRTSLLATWSAFDGNASASSRIMNLTLQYRLGTTGTFTTVASSTYTTTGTATPAASSTFTNVALPSACDGQAIVQIRWIYYESAAQAGSRHSIRLDDITVSSSPAAVPSIAISGVDPGASSVTVGTSNVVLQQYNLAVTTAATNFTGLNVTTAGTYASADITNLKVRYSTDAVLDGADATLSTLTTPGAAGSKTFPTFTSQAISSGATGYIFITADVAAGATAGNTINIASNAFTNFTFSSGTKTGTDPVAAAGVKTFAALVPSIAISGVDPGASSVTVGTSNVVLHQYNLAVTTAATNLAGLNVTTAGTYATADITNLKVRYSTDAILDGADATLSTLTSPGTAGLLTFSSFTSQAISSGAAGYIFITADVAAGATGGNTINIASNAFTNFTFSSGTKTGTDPVAAAGVKTFSSLVSSIAISNSAPASSNQNAGTTNVVLQRLDLAVTVTSTSITGLTVTTAGSYASADITNLKVRYSTDATLDGADATLSTFTTPGVAGSKVFPSITTQALASGAAYYLFITADIAASATGGNTISLGSTAFSNISFSTGTKTGTDPVAGSNIVTIVNPAIAVTSSSPAASSHIQGSTNIVLNRFDFAVTSSNATLTGISVTTAGTYISADLLNLKVRFSTDNILDAGDATLSTFTTPGIAGSKVFPSFVSQSITSGTTGYIFITADISATATQNNTINLATTAFSNLTFSLGNLTGTNPVAVGNARTFIKAEPTNYPSSFACGTTTPTTIPLTWTDASAGVTPDGYLIQWSNTGYGSITAPTDGSAVTDLASAVLGAKNIAQGVGSYSIPTLSSLTTYYLRIWSYTNSGSNINYKLVSEPQTSCATLIAPVTIVTFPSSWVGITSTAPSVSQDANINGTVTATRGAGLVATSSSTRFSSSDWPSSGTLTLASNTDYITFTVNAAVGYLLNLNNAALNFTLGSTGTGPTSYGVYSSVGGFASTAAQIGANLTTSSTSVTFPSSGYDGLSTIEIRIYGWGASALAGTGGFASMNLTGNLVSLGTITTGTVSTSICAGATGVSVPFTYTPSVNFPSGTATFTSQLSNAAGSFASPVTLQSVTSDASGSQSISATIPALTTTGSGYRIRVVSASPGVNGSDNASNISISNTATSIAPSTTQNITTSTNGTTLTVTEGTTASSRVWKYGTVSGVYGTSTGITTSTYTPNFVLPGTYYIVCETTYPAPCSNVITSNEVQVNVVGSVDYTWNGSVSSDWSNSSNWTPNGVPIIDDNVTINVPGTNTLIVTDARSINNLTVSGTGTFQLTSSGVLSVYASVTNSIAGSPTFNCASTFSMLSASSQTIPSWNFGNLIASGGARVLSSTGTIGICGTFTPGAGAYTNAGSTVNFNGTGAQTVNAINYNNLSISGAHSTNSIILPAGSIGIAGTFSPTATFSSGTYSNTGNTIDYNGAGAQTVAAFSSYNNLTISGARASATVTLASGTIGVAGTFNPSATLVSYVSTGNTFDYTSSGSQTIAIFSQYNNLSNSGNGARTLANGIIAIYGTYTPTSAAVTVGTSTVDFAGVAGQTIPASFYYNITNSSNTNRTWANVGIIDIKNAFTPTTSTNTITGSTIQYSATSGSLNLTTFTTNLASRNYNNLIFNGTGGTWTLNANTIGVANDLTVSAGTLIIGVAAGAGTLNVDGNLTVNGGTFNTTNTTTAGNLNLLGNLTVSLGTFTKSGSGVGAVNLIKSTGTQIFSQSGGTISNANAWNFGNGTIANTIQIATNISASTGVFNVNSGTTVDFGTNTLTVTSGAFNLNSGATLNTTNAAGIKTAGATGSILRSSGSSTFSTSANYIFGGAITGTGFTGANNLTINNASVVTLSAAATVNGALTFTNGLLDIAAVNLTITGSIAGANTAKYVKTSGAGQLKMTVAASNVLFPVGRSAYNPLTLNNSGTSDVFGVVLTDAISQSLNNSSLVVNRSWNITETVAGGSSLSIVSQWNGAAEQAASFAAGTTPRIAYWNGSAWVQTGATQAGANPYTFASTANITGIGSATYSIAIGKDDAFNCSSVPTVSLVLPTSGYSGDVITINGTGLTGLTAATIGGTAATIVSQSGTSATLSVGAGTTGVITVSKSALCSASGSQTFTFNGFISAQTGNWSLGSTWQGGVVPPDLATVTIANSHVVTVDALTNPASVFINAGAELTGTDDLKQLYVGSTGNGPVSVTGTLSLGTALVSNGRLVCGTLSVNNGGIFNNNCGNAIAAGLNVTSLTLASGATYNHNALGSTLNGTLSDFPGLTGGTNISINSNANVNITRWAQNTGTPSSLPSVSGGQWGNLTVNISGLTYSGSWQNSGILTNANSLNIVNTGTRDFRLVTPTGTAGFTCTIGSVNVSGGILVLIGGGSIGSGVVTMNVTNNFNVSGGVVSIHGSSVTQSYNTTGVTLNLAGNLNITGGSFYGHANSLNNTAAASSSATTLNVTGNLSINNGTLNLAYFPNYNFVGNTGNVNLNVKGNLTLGATGVLRNSNSIAPLGKTTATVNFNHASAQQTWNQTGTIQDVIGLNVNGTANTLQLLSNANIGTSTTSSFNVANATTFDLQAFVLGGSGTFTSAAGSTLKLGNSNGIITIPTLSGNVQLLTSRTFNAATNYTYSGSINQVTGNALPLTMTGALSIANTGAASNNTVTLSTTGTTASNFNLTNGLFAAGTGQQLNIASGGTVIATSGDFATGSTAGILNFPGTGTFTGNSNPYNVYTSGAVNFGSGTVTIQPAGTFRINTGGSVNTNAPFYASGSTLQYNTTGVYGRNLEWRTSSGRGYPHHVQVSNSTTLNPGANSNIAQPFNTGGNLTIDVGSNIYMDYGALNMTVPLSVIGGLNLNGNLSLSGVTGGVINVGGDWINNGTNSNFITNNRAVIFNGSINQNIGGTNTSSNPFAYVTINNPSGVTLTYGQEINNQLTFSNGSLSLGNFDLAMNGLNTPIIGFSNSKFIITNGSGILYRNFNGVNTIYPVGPSSTSYNPLTLNQAGTPDNIGVRVATTPSFSNSINDNNQMVLLEYFLSEVTPGGNNLTTSFQWNSTNEGSTFNRSGGVYQANWDGFNWVVRPSLTTSGSDPYTSTSTVNYTGNLINTAMIVGNINGIYSCISTASNGSWSNPNIWLSGIVPPSDASVCINNPITLAGTDVNIANVTINSSGSLTVDPNINLNIADLGGIVNNSGATTSLGQGNVVFTGIGFVSGSNSVTIKNLTLNRNTTLTATTKIDGNLTLNSGAYIIAGSPTYSATSTLIYATGGNYTSSNEWNANASVAGLGTPQNVLLNGTNLSLASGNRGLLGDLTINSGALSLNSSSGDLYVGGNWNRASTATFNSNNRAVLFTGAANQTITTNGGGNETFTYLIANKTSGNLVLNNSPATNVIVGASSGNVLEIAAGNTIDLNGQSLSLTGIGGNINLPSGPTSITGSSGSVFSISNGLKTITPSIGSSIDFGANVKVALNSGFNFGATTSTINGTLQIANGGFISTNPPSYAAGSTLRYFTGNSFSRGLEWSTNSGPGYPHHVLVDLNSTVTTLNLAPGAAACQIAGNLTVNEGAILNMGAMANPLVVLGDVNVGGASSGTLSLSSVAGGDIKIGGNLTRNAGGTLTQNGREVEMNGAITQNISGVPIFAYLAINNSAASVKINDNTTINTRLRLSNGVFDLNSLGCTLANGSKIVRVNGTMSASPSVLGTNIYDLEYQNSVISGVEYLASSTAVRDLIITIGNTLTLGDNRTFNRDLTLSGGDLNLGGFTLTAKGRATSPAFSGSIKVSGGGARSITGPAGSTFDITGLGANLPNDYTKTVSSLSGSTLSFDSNVLVRIGDGAVDFGVGSPTTINGTLQVLLGGSVGQVLNPCYYGVNSLLRFANTVDYQVGTNDKTWASGSIASGNPGIPYNVEVMDANTDLQLQSTRALRGNLTITNGTFTLTPAYTGSFNIGGNWTRSGVTSAFNHNSKKVVFNRQTAGIQTITLSSGISSETFYDLEISLASGNLVTATSSALSISNNLNFVSGKIDLGANRLTIGTALTNGTITGANISKYVITNAVAGGGNIKAFTNTNTAYVFPVGDATNYSPMTVILTNGAQVGSYISTTAVQGIHPNLLTGAPPTKYISRYWSVEPSGLAINPVYNVSYSYVVADEVGTGTLYPIKYSTSTTTPGWLSCPGSPAAAITGTSGANDNVLKTFTWNGLTTFSDFTGAGDGSPLPVTWLNFDAQFNNTSNNVDVTWTTASEINNDYFEILRSNDAVNFHVIGKVDGAGNSSLVKDYIFEDSNPLTGISYYKIRQVDFNGIGDFTEIRAVSNLGGIATGTLFAYPNPLIGQDLTIVYSNLDKGNWEYRLVDITGKIVLAQNRTSELNAGAFTLNLEQLPAGIYLFQLNTQSQNFTRKITISK